MLFRCLSRPERKLGDYALSYANALAKTDSESSETTVRRQRMLFAGFVARMGEERLPRRVMFGELAGGKGHAGEQDKDWMVALEEDMREFRMEYKGWRKAAQKAGRWFRRVEDGGVAFTQKWHGGESCRVAEGHGKAAAAPTTVDTKKRQGRGRRGGGRRGRGGAGGGGEWPCCPRDRSLGLAIIVLTFGCLSRIESS